MNQFIWRQYRKQIVLNGGAVIAFALVLTGIGWHRWHEYRQALLSGGLIDFLSHAAAPRLALAVVAFPVLFGMFWGAPLIGREYADGTNKFIWMQGITRRQWLAGKLIWVMGVGAVYAALLSAAATWCLWSDNAVLFNRFGTLTFMVQGIVPLGYTVFAVAVGAWAGAWFRSTLKAVALTLAMVAITMFAVAQFVRPHYAPALVAGPSQRVDASISEDGQVERNQGASWILKRTYKVVSEDCTVINGSRQCGRVLDVDKTIYHPESRFWIFQIVECGLYLLLSAGLSLATYRLIIRRDA